MGTELAAFRTQVAQAAPTPTPPPAEPDKVVGVVLRCTYQYFDRDGSGAARQTFGEECIEGWAPADRIDAGPDDIRLFVSDHQYEITVRTPQGNAYQVTVAAQWRQYARPNRAYIDPPPPELGSAWPPEE